MADKLAAAGFGDVQSLAKASPAKVAAALESKDRAQARTIINEAKRVLKG
jgi:hypothetical protein